MIKIENFKVILEKIEFLSEAPFIPERLENFYGKYSSFYLEDKYSIVYDNYEENSKKYLSYLTYLNKDTYIIPEEDYLYYVGNEITNYTKEYNSIDLNFFEQPYLVYYGGEKYTSNTDTIVDNFYAGIAEDYLIYGNTTKTVNGTVSTTLAYVPPMTFSSPTTQNLVNYRIYGKTAANGEGVGDLVSSGEHQGEYIIPVTISKDNQSVTENIYLSSPLQGAKIYGIHLTPGESEYNIEYLGGAVGKTPASMNFSTGVFDYGGWENAFFMPRPCMLKYDGTVDYYLDPNDYTKRVDISIPEDYKPVNYLKRTGNNVSYINTDIYINSYATTKADLAIKFENWYSSNDNTSYIGANGGGERDVWFSNKSGTRQNEIFFWNGRGLNESYVSVQTLALGTLYNTHLGADYFAINDSKASVTPTPVETSLPGYPIVIFGRNNNGTIEAYNKTDLTIYNVVIRDVVNGAETITHFLIPAERQSDDQLGLYDSVTGVFYPATGTFIKGEYGIKSDCDNIHCGGNAMMEWPKIWYKFAPGTIDGEGYFYVSDQKIDDDYHCWCNLDCNGNEIDHFYTPIYSCVQYDGKMRSICGFKQSAIGYDYTRATYITYATANNTTENVEWYTETFCDRQLIDALLMMIGKTTNFQNTYGRGIQESNSLHYTGEANDRGLFFGSSANTSSLKIFGMEDWWGAHYRYFAGAMIINTQSPNIPKLLYKLTWSDVDGSEVTGYQEDQVIGNNPQTAGYKQADFTMNDIEWQSTKYYIFTNDLYRPYPSKDSAVPTLVDMISYITPSNYNSNKSISIGAGQMNTQGDMNPLAFWTSHLSNSSPYRVANISCKPVASSQMATQTTSGTVDYIDYITQKRYDSNGNETSITLPTLSLYQGENILSIGTNVQPSQTLITFLEKKYDLNNVGESGTYYTYEIGTSPLTFTSQVSSLIDCLFYGKTEKIDGVNKGVGNLITDTSSEYYGKYNIPISLITSNNNQQNYNLYLDNPLLDGDLLKLSDTSVTITVDTNTQYSLSVNTTVLPKKIKILTGTASKYKVPIILNENEVEDYILLNKPLKKVGEVTDYLRYNSNGNNIIYNIKKITLNGTENWEVDSEKFYINTAFSDCKVNSSVYCNRINSKILEEPNKSDDIWISNEGKLCIIKHDLPLNIDAIKTYLSNNTTIIYYQLSTPITEEVYLPPLLMEGNLNGAEKENTIKINTETVPSQFKVQNIKKYYTLEELEEIINNKTE